MAQDPKQLEKQERIQRAKNKLRLMRQGINRNESNRLRLLNLVREYVAQRPEVTAQIIKKWIA